MLRCGSGGEPGRWVSILQPGEIMRAYAFALIIFGSGSVYAQGSGDAAAPAAPAAAPAPAPAPAAESFPQLRNGFSLSAGEEFGSEGNVSFSAQLYGVDWRIGERFSPAISAYVHSHLSFGTGGVSGSGKSGATGNFAIAAVGEYELPMRLFVGAGGGYGVLNNPSGPLAELRVGYYPFEHNGPDKSRHLNVAVDARWYFVSDGPNSVTVSHIALSLGYDRF